MLQFIFAEEDNTPIVGLNCVGSKEDNMITISEAFNVVNVPIEYIKEEVINGHTIIMVDEFGNSAKLEAIKAAILVDNEQVVSINHIKDIAIQNSYNLYVIGQDPITSLPTMEQLVTIVPTIMVDLTSLDFGDVVENTVSEEEIIIISASSLEDESGNIVVTAPAGFQISLTSAGGFASSVNVPFTNSELQNTTIYVTFNPTAVQEYTGNITLTGGGAEQVDVEVIGNGIAA